MRSASISNLRAVAAGHARADRHAAGAGAIADNLLGAKLLFAIKETVYKAAYPLDHEFLDFHGIEVDLAGRLATTRAGRTLALHWCVFSHVLVVATVQKASMDHLPSS